MSSDDDLHQIEIGVAYRNLPARAPRPVDIGRDTLERQIQVSLAMKPGQCLLLTQSDDFGLVRSVCQ